MNRDTNRVALSALAVILVALMFSPAELMARYQNYPNVPYYPAYLNAPYYQAGPYPYYAMPGQGYRNYVRPQWYMRGRVNRFGDYRVDIKLRNISQQDSYKAWLLFQFYGNQ